MKALTEAVTVKKSTNCGGRDETFQERDFEFEASDVGRRLEHYLGHNHAEYTVKRSDVGRALRMTRQSTGYACWSFL